MFYDWENDHANCPMPAIVTDANGVRYHNCFQVDTEKGRIVLAVLDDKGEPKLNATKTDIERETLTVRAPVTVVPDTSNKG